MPRTKTTRVGNGAGKGNWASGPAKGEGKRLKPAGDPASDAARALALDPKHMAAKAVLREVALTTLLNVMQDGENEGARVTAALGMARKVGLVDEPATTLLGGVDGGPVVVVKRLFVPPPDGD